MVLDVLGASDGRCYMDNNTDLAQELIATGAALASPSETRRYDQFERPEVWKHPRSSGEMMVRHRGESVNCRAAIMIVLARLFRSNRCSTNVN